MYAQMYNVCVFWQAIKGRVVDSVRTCKTVCVCMYICTHTHVKIRVQQLHSVRPNMCKLCMILQAISGRMFDSIRTCKHVNIHIQELHGMCRCVICA